MLASQKLEANGSTVKLVAPSSVSHPANLLPQESTNFGTATRSKRSSDRNLSLLNMNYENLFPIKQAYTSDMSLTNNSRAPCRGSYTHDVTNRGRPPGVIRIDTRNYDSNEAKKGSGKIARTTTNIPDAKRAVDSYHIDGQRYTTMRNSDNQNLLQSSVLLPDSPESSSIATVPFPPPPLKFTQIQSTCEGNTRKPQMKETAHRQSSISFGVDGAKHVFPKSVVKESDIGFNVNSDPTRLGAVQYDSRIARIENNAATDILGKSAIPPQYEHIVKTNLQTAPADAKGCELENKNDRNKACADLENVQNLAKTPLSKWKNKTSWPKPRPFHVILLLLFLLLIAVALMIFFATGKRSNGNSQDIKTLPISSQPPSTAATPLPEPTRNASKLNKTPCLTDDCIKIAANIINKMNRNADPCEDFYEYACGGWMQKNYIPPDRLDYGVRVQTEQRNKQTLYQALIKPDGFERTVQDSRGDYGNLSAAEKKAKVFFKSCMNRRIIENLGAQPLLDLINDTGGWFALGNWNQTRWNFDSMLNMLHAEQKVYAFFVTTILRGRNELAIAPGGFSLPDRLFYIMDQMELGASSVVVRYKTFIKTVLRLLRVNNVNDTSADIYQVEKDLAQVIQNSTTVPSTRLANAEELTKICPKINWQQLIPKLKGRQKDDNIPVLVLSANYLKQLQAYLTSSNPRALHNYMVWRLVIKRMEYLSRDFQEASNKFFSFVVREKPSKPLLERCMDSVGSYLKWAAAALFVRQTVNADKAANQVQEMVRHIQSAFRDNLKSVPWMDENTTLAAYEKFDLDERTYFKNMVALIRGKRRQALDNAFRRKPIVSWTSLPYTMNAYYSPKKNKMGFPTGLLQPPFFSTEYPSSLNYGCLGSIIGHEMSHGFDDIGQRTDKYGDLNPLWSRVTGDAFLSRTSCVVNAYKDYRIGSNFVDARRTLPENIGDMAGLKLSYMAYKKYIKNNPQTRKNLPGSSLSDDKQFFLGYAQTLCDKRLPKSHFHQLLTSKHSPAKFRVLGAVSNNKDFAKAYNCKLGTPMNPKKKCSVW